jgi:hypothetical protein
MYNRPQSIELRFSEIYISLSRSSFVKALCSLYTRGSQFVKRMLAQTENKDANHKKDNNSSETQQSEAPITNKDTTPDTKKGKLTPSLPQEKSREPISHPPPPKNLG